MLEEENRMLKEKRMEENALTQIELLGNNLLQLIQNIYPTDSNQFCKDYYHEVKLSFINNFIKPMYDNNYGIFDAGDELKKLNIIIKKTDVSYIKSVIKHLNDFPLEVVKGYTPLPSIEKISRIIGLGLQRNFPEDLLLREDVDLIYKVITSCEPDSENQPSERDITILKEFYKASTMDDSDMGNINYKNLTYYERREYQEQFSSDTMPSVCCKSFTFRKNGDIHYIGNDLIIEYIEPDNTFSIYTINDLEWTSSEDGDLKNIPKTLIETNLTKKQVVNKYYEVSTKRKKKLRKIFINN